MTRGAGGIIALHEIHLDDQLAARSYLKRSLMWMPTGSRRLSYGGIQTVLAVEANAEQRLGLRTAIDFAGATISWRSASLRERMVRAVREATAPIFFIQAQNDYDLAPSHTLAGELERLGKPLKLLIFPPCGDTREEGHGAFCFRGGNVWGADVFSFLEAARGK